MAGIYSFGMAPPKILFSKTTPLPRSPGFTLVASNQLSEDDRARLERAIVDMDPEVIARMQPAFVAKLGSFVPDKEAEFKTLLQAMSETGCVR